MIPSIISALSLVRLGLAAGYVVLVTQGCGWWGVPLLALFVLPASRAPAINFTVKP
jgi:hypothetical protein